MSIAKFLKDFDDYRAEYPVGFNNGVLSTTDPTSPHSQELRWYLDGGMRERSGELFKDAGNDAWMARLYGPESGRDIMRAIRLSNRNLAQHSRARWIRQLLQKRMKV